MAWNFGMIPYQTLMINTNNYKLKLNNYETIIFNNDGSTFFSTTITVAQQTNNPIAKVADTGCTGQDTFDQGVKIVPNANSWTDSYQANDFCFCKSSFDHGVGNFKITINGQGRNIRAICDELKKHPKFRNIRNGDPRYNTINCGNDPGHGDAITIGGKRIKDEKVCPGRVDQGSRGCKCKGPKFDMNWLKTRTRFGGNGGGNGGDGNGDGGGNNSGGSVTFKGQSNNKFVSSENGGKPMTTNRGRAGAWEKFAVQNAGGGTVSIKGNNGKFVSSENGNKAMTCNRGSVRGWEKFKLESMGGNLYAIKGNNGKYVSHQNNGLICNKNTVGGTEKFIINGLNNGKRSIEIPSKISLYPNPLISKGDLNIQIDTPRDAFATVEAINIAGQIIGQQNLGELKAGTNAISLSELANKIQVKGFYLFLVRVDGAKDHLTKVLYQ